MSEYFSDQRNGDFALTGQGVPVKLIEKLHELIGLAMTALQNVITGRGVEG